MMRKFSVVAVVLSAGLSLTLSASLAQAAVNLLNPSFEQPVIDPNTNPFLAIPDVQDWDEIDPLTSSGNNSTGTFLNLNLPGQFIANVDGTQAAFIEATPPAQLSGIDGIAISQVSTDRFAAGSAYKIAAWFGKSRQSIFGGTPDDNALLAVRLFYQPDGDPTNRALDDSVLIDSWTVRAGDLDTEALTMFMWTSDPIAPGSDAVNQRIGLAFTPIDFTLSDNPPDNSGRTATFNIDNVSLHVVPEPTTLALAILGGLALLRRKFS